MPRTKSRGLAALAVALVALPVLLLGCGSGGGNSSSQPTAAELKKCILEGGGRKWGQVPTEPSTAPKTVETVYMVGPAWGHISYYLDKKPQYTAKLIKEFDEIQEYDAFRILDGKGMLLLDPDIKARDRELAYACLEG